MRIVAIALLLVCACGGKLDTGDGGGDGGTASDGHPHADGPTSTDAIAFPDVHPSCKLGMGSGTTSSNGSCSATQAYTCGEIDFSISCDCPAATCTCVGGTPMTVSTALACPSCDVLGHIQALAQLCGFPSP
jgi:hypothetical protein